MKRLLLFVALCAACKQQDAALLVTITGQYRIPADADKLSMDIFDGTTVIKNRQWCVTPTSTCASLPLQTSLSASVTLVESGSDHAHVKINVTLFKGASLVGRGTNTASFQSGTTLDVPIEVTP